jgi:hypothetical protein
MNNLVWKYVKPLKNDNSIQRFETHNNVRLPSDIIACIKQNNGGRPDKKVFDTETTNERVIKSLLSFNEDDLETVYDILDVVKTTKSSLIPVASDPFGNYVCYDSDAGEIVLWLHETDYIEKITDTFSSFLNKLR